jgi:hypothetical protein
MQFIIPHTLTDAALLASSLTAEDIAPAWSAATSYTEGDQVMRAATHSVYSRLVAGVSAATPEADAANWVRVGPTNRWAMFDKSVGTRTQSNGPISLTVRPPGVGAGLALLDLIATRVDISVVEGGTTTFNTSIALHATNAADWWEYFFGEMTTYRTALAVTGLPITTTCEVQVTIHGSGTVACGTFAVGPVVDVGPTRLGLQLGIVDYSRKTTDAFGNTTVTERTFAKRLTATAFVDSARVDFVARKLSDVRATPVVWIGSGLYDHSLAYGFFKDFGIDIQYQRTAVCSLTIEGLS